MLRGLAFEKLTRGQAKRTLQLWITAKVMPQMRASRNEVQAVCDFSKPNTLSHQRPWCLTVPPKRAGVSA
ncbi:hypothetical protein SAMN05216337_106713 [Bradyrhizobium brasilense]|uniref:Uncharacterized protein n=1 Tax=Bradyrhizobium brasilense TaxID=1419277 RepID=A0A1G7N239_9BRAD|nr:hypothetical protein SAMN05216337_106713 [Bradyrhizobium brasilense]